MRLALRLTLLLALRLALRPDEPFDRARSADAPVDAFLSGLRTNIASSLDGLFERRVDDPPAFLPIDFLGADALDDDFRD